MSNEFVIVFLGLIAHFSLPAGNPQFERAILVEHMHHTPYLFLRSTDIDYTGGCVRAPKLANPEVYWSSPKPPAPNCNPVGPGPKCIAAYSVYESKPVAENVTMYVKRQGKESAVTVRRDAVVMIVNLSDSTHHGPDYKEHLWLNDGRCILHLNRKTGVNCSESPDNICPGITKNIGDLVIADDITINTFVAKYNLEVECSQAQNPPPP